MLQDAHDQFIREKIKTAKKKERDRKDRNKWPAQIKRQKKSQYIEYMNDDNEPINLRRIKNYKDI